MSSDQIISVESGNNPYAQNPRSSAGGLGQFIDKTWIDTLSEARPDLTTGRSRAEILAMKFDPQLSQDMTEFYAQKNNAALEAAGHPVRPGTTYLAHFAGPAGAVKVLGADPSAPVGGILGPGAVKANPFLANMTAGGLIGWADKKMGGAPAPMPQQLSGPPQAPMIGAAPMPPMMGAQASVAPAFNNMAPPVTPPQQPQAEKPEADPYAQAEKEHFAATKAAPMLGLQQLARRRAFKR